MTSDPHIIKNMEREQLHAAMSALSFTATYLVNLLAKEPNPAWVVRRVA